MLPSQHPPEAHSSDEWISVTDLMAGLLMVFALLVIATLFQLKQIEEQNRNKRVIVIQALQEQFNAKGISAQINPETGDITLLDSILFGYDESKLSYKGVEFLKIFIPTYGETLFKNLEISDEITRIIIEGHTSSDGGIAYNMSLSLLRANSVYRFIGTHAFPEQLEFMKKIQVSGRGMVDANKEISEAADRKVLFRMQFKSDEAFKTFLK